MVLLCNMLCEDFSITVFSIKHDIFGIPEKWDPGPLGGTGDPGPLGGTLGWDAMVGP